MKTILGKVEKTGNITRSMGEEKKGREIPVYATKRMRRREGGSFVQREWEYTWGRRT